MSDQDQKRQNPLPEAIAAIRAEMERPVPVRRNRPRVDDGSKPATGPTAGVTKPR